MVRQFISFEIDGQLFGIDIDSIREIRAWAPVTRIPGVPDHVIGVANLRGQIIPVIDLAMRFGWPPVRGDERHAIIVVAVDGQLHGLVVESVSDLVAVEESAIQPPPAIQDERVAAFLEGIAPAGERLILVLRLSALTGAGPAIALPRLHKRGGQA